MKYKKTALFGFVCVSMLIFQACLSKGIWYQFLNCVVDIVPHRFQFEKDGKNISIPIVASHPLDQMNNHTRYLIIAIHGGGLNSKNTFETVHKVIHMVNRPQDNFLVIAPQIIEGVKLKERGLLFWDQKWRGGGRSLSKGLNEGLPRVSSFEVIDQLINHSIKMHHGIKQIFIMGHSAGGQFVMRYAAVNSVHDKLEEHGITVWYIPANPSSYLYLNDLRYQFSSDDSIKSIPPEKINGCSEYNSYKYGLENFYGYAQEISKETIQDRLLTRPIIFLLGAKDNERDWSLDKSCQGELQGENRYQRGGLYKYHLDQIAGNKLVNRYIWLEIPDVGHDATAMLTHPIFIEHLNTLLK